MENYENFEVVMWPMSQVLMTKQGFKKHCKLINSEKGIELYGSSAYLVEKKWLSDVIQGNINDSYDETEDENEELDVIYDYPLE